MKIGKVRHQVRKRIRKSDTRRLLQERYRMMKVIEKSPFDNIYHCCTQKTASMAFKNIFDDADVFYYTGLKHTWYKELGLREADITDAFPVGTVVTKLYMSFPTYDAIPKSENHRTFFILRDPRDIVVSWYYSMKYSHVEVGPVGSFRQELQDLDIHDGLKQCIDTLDRIGLFEAQRSWIDLPQKQKEICRVFHYEDFASDHTTFLSNLFDFLEIHMPDDVFAQLCERHSFQTRAKGRKQGQENQKSHYRKGIAGDWKEHFDDEIDAYFESVAGDLVTYLGYT